MPPVLTPTSFPGGGGGVSDHGLLTGLADDDHTQYHNDARGDARYERLVPPVTTVAASGSTESIAFGGVYDVTMDQNCTFTFTGAPSSGSLGTMLLILRGAFDPTWPASVDWSGAAEPTYASPAVYTFTTVDGGTTVFGAAGGVGFV